MKRILLLFCTALLLVACGKDETKEVDREEGQETNSSEQGKNETEEEATREKSEDESEDDTEEDFKEVGSTDIEDLEEYDILAEHIDLEEFTGTIEVDHEKNRVIDFQNGKGDYYKSHYRKEENLLQIVRSPDNHPVFQENIK